MANFSKLPVENELVQLVLNFFFHNQLNIIEAEGLFYDDFVLD